MLYAVSRKRSDTRRKIFISITRRIRFKCKAEFRSISAISQKQFCVCTTNRVRSVMLLQTADDRPGMWSRSRRLGLETVSRRTNVSSRSRLGLGLGDMRLGSRLGLGSKGLVHIPAIGVLESVIGCAIGWSSFRSTIRWKPGLGLDDSVLLIPTLTVTLIDPMISQMRWSRATYSSSYHIITLYYCTSFLGYTYTYCTPLRRCRRLLRHSPTDRHQIWHTYRAR